MQAADSLKISKNMREYRKINVCQKWSGVSGEAQEKCATFSWPPWISVEHKSTVSDLPHWPRTFLTVLIFGFPTHFCSFSNILHTLAKMQLISTTSQPPALQMSVIYRRWELFLTLSYNFNFSVFKYIFSHFRVLTTQSCVFLWCEAEFQNRTFCRILFAELVTIKNF